MQTVQSLVLIEMNVIRVSFLISLIYFCDGASIYQKNDTLETFKNDISNVGSAIENFTFDILRSIIEEDSEETEETTTSSRKKRSVNDELLESCQKRCREEYTKNQTIEAEQIKDLKAEIKNLQEIVRILQEQQKMIKVLDKGGQNEAPTKKESTEKTEDEENIPNKEQLSIIKFDLKEAIESLNETKEFLSQQKKKIASLERELFEQQEEINEVKTAMNAIVNKNITEEKLKKPQNEEELHSMSARSSDMSEIKKFLKNLPDDDDTDEDDLRTKIIQLQRMLRRKKQQENLAKELKELEKSLAAENSPKDLMQQLIKALHNTEPQSKTTNVDVTTLEDLQEAISNLRPKENNEAAQFQTMLNKLINRPSPTSTFNPRPGQITITPQQMAELTKKLNPNNYPYICIVDDGGVKSNGYRVPVNSRNFQFYATGPADYNNQKPQFFPVQFTPPNYYPQANTNGVGPEKSFNYQSESTDINQRYKEDLKNQIEGLQAAINNLNRPEYTQNPDDKATIENLERQIADLRGIVDNLNYDGYYQGNRTKRSLDDNKVDDNKVDDNNEFLQEMKNIVGKILDDDKTNTGKHFEDIQNKIDILKNQLDTDANKERASTTTQQWNADSYTNQLINLPSKGMKTSTKTDFFSELVSKLLDKVISVIPIVVQKLFNFSLEELSKNDYKDYDVQVLFKNLGIFAYLPVIALRLIRGIASFLNILKKNAFFRNFLMPALILGTVAGSTLFLIWWLQPEDYVNSSNSQYQTSYSPSDTTNYYDQNNNYYNKYPVSSNYPVYSKTYFSQ